MYLNPEFKFAKLPWTAGRVFFRHANVVDLMNIAFASNSTDWLTNMTSTPTCFSVNFVSSQMYSQDHWEIRMDFRDNESFVWCLWPNATKTYGAKIKWMIGKHKLITIIEGKENDNGPIVINSFMVGFQETLFEIINWLEKLFNCKVTFVNIPMLVIEDSSMTARWSVLRYVETLTIRNSCAWSEWIVGLLKERHVRGFKTYIKDVEIGRPGDISVESLSSLSYKSGRLNFNLLSFDFFVDYIKSLMTSDDPRFLILRARIPDWTIEKVNDFGKKLNLTPCNSNLSHTHYSTYITDFNQNLPQFKYNKTVNTVLGFNFLIKPGQLYGRMAVVKWTQKGLEQIAHERQEREFNQLHLEELMARQEIVVFERDDGRAVMDIMFERFAQQRENRRQEVEEVEEDPIVNDPRGRAVMNIMFERANQDAQYRENRNWFRWV